MNTTEQPLLLIIDDETAILETLKEALEDEHYRIETLADASKALDRIGELLPDVVFLDIFMPSHNGIAILERIRHEYPAQKVIMISGYGTIPIAIEAIQKGAFDFIEKPLNLDEILNKISFLKKAHSHQIAPQQLNQTNFSCDIIGASALFCELMHHANLVAQLKVPLLIYGNPGSGKTLLARYVHHKNGFDNSSFMTLSCATLRQLPPHLADHHGSIFFKNIHELDTKLQSDVVEYLATERPHQKFIASSSLNLFARVKTGSFNRSLFCLLHASSLEIPSLIKRRYDIPLLVEHFLSKSNQKYGTATTLSPTALRFLRNFEWKGDVAQLQTCIDVVVGALGTTHKTIQASDFCTLIPSQPTDQLEQQAYTRFSSLDDATHSFQQRYLHHMLKLHRYDTAQLADFLQMPLATLHAKMAELNISH